MIQCEGQISIMDLLAPVIRTAEIPCLLHEGQTVYKVVRGDVETHTVQKRTWTCGGNNRGYDLDGDVTWNSQIGKIIFTSREPAERVAQEYLAEYEHILAENIRATGVIAYRYEYRGREIVQSYSISNMEVCMNISVRKLKSRSLRKNASTVLNVMIPMQY